MIKVLYVIDSLMAGGVENQMTQLILHLDPQQIKTSVVCLYGERAGRSLQFMNILKSAKFEVELLDLDWSMSSKLQAILAIRRIVRTFQPDIVHAQNYHSNLLTRLSRPFWGTNSKLIASVRNAQTPKQKMYDRLSQPLYDAIICNGKQLEEILLQEVGLPKNKVYFIPNGIDLKRFQQSANEDVLLLEHFPEARRLFVMVGRVTEQKSPHLLALAVGLLLNQGNWNNLDKVIIVGETQTSDAPWQEKLNQTVQQYGLEEIVFQHPQTNQPEVYYAKADVTVLPSLWEGLPNVMLESLAAGKPIIISEAANAAQVIEHGLTGWIVRTGDIDQLAATLKMVANLPEDALKAMYSACVATAERYGFDKLVEAHMQVYQGLIQ